MKSRFTFAFFVVNFPCLDPDSNSVGIHWPILNPDHKYWFFVTSQLFKARFLWVWRTGNCRSAIFSAFSSELRYSESEHLCFKQCGGSGMFIPDPGSWFLAIPDPGSKNSNERQGVKKNLLLYLFFGDINFTKLNYLTFEMLKKKNLGQFSKNYRTFYPKNCL